ncbi:hypothetical protein PENTCL1PPCAC_20160, partial [Pristionchus entomophagus]
IMTPAPGPAPFRANAPVLWSLINAEDEKPFRRPTLPKRRAVQATTRRSPPKRTPKPTQPLLQTTAPVDSHSSAAPACTSAATTPAAAAIHSDPS